jgi:diaminohydroxyphosphoribosylaminopyrimidine deaminase/5-amino-6-(5-phosphoribosylamino)uracil reductase
MTDERYMQRALELALGGEGHVSPNPLVGCVLVKERQIIGEGWHRQYGHAHAEVEALESVTDKEQITGSTVFVNLEPCSHVGKTPPCADRLIREKVARVVIANEDPNPLVNGAGIKKLRDAGIEVVTGVLEGRGRELNRRFFLFHEKQRPYVILKWAQTFDRFIAHPNGDSKWISNEYSRQWVHRWRAGEAAVLVGTKTAAHDNPQLTVRDWTGPQPTRIVIDRFLRLPERLALFDRKQPTLSYNLLKHEEHPNLALVRLGEENFLRDMLHDLHQRNIQSVIVEGGAMTLRLFIEAGLWDEARIFTSQRSFGKGISAPSLSGRRTATHDIHGDRLDIIRNESPS